MEVCNTVQEGGIKTIPKKKKYKKAKWLSEEALQIAEKRREVKSKGEKKRFSVRTKVIKYVKNDFRNIKYYLDCCCFCSGYY